MSTSSELARLAGRIAALEATNRTRSTQCQLESLIAISDSLIGLLEGRAPATVSAAVVGFAGGLIESAERGGK